MIRGLAFIAILGLLGGCNSSPGTPSAPKPEDERVKTLVDLGMGYIRNGDYSRAKEHLNRALSVDPRSALAHDALGIVFQLEQEFEIAEEHFRKAVRYQPNWARARNNYGAFLFARERYEDAIKQLVVAAEDRYYESRPVVFENLGRAHLRVGNRDAAERAFERSIALNPEQGLALLELALIRYEQGRYTAARELYLRHQQVAARSSKALWLCVRLARVFDNGDQEASCALALRNIFPASPEFELYRESLAE